MRVAAVFAFIIDLIPCLMKTIIFCGPGPFTEASSDGRYGSAAHLFPLRTLPDQDGPLPGSAGSSAGPDRKSRTGYHGPFSGAGDGSVPFVCQ